MDTQNVVKKMLKIKIQKTHPKATTPKYAKPGDSGMDLFTLQQEIIQPNQTKLIKTGLKIEIPQGYEAQIRPRSGLALNNSITVLNTPGTIDSGYRGEIGIILINHSKEPYQIKHQEKIAQMVFQKVEQAYIEETSELSTTERNEKGFGSTGKE